MIMMIKRWLELKRKRVKIWGNCNVYRTAEIGWNVQVGSFTEIGDGVVIGDNVRIGAMCFIPSGVTIEDRAWIGPRVTFTNDRYPPSPKGMWERTTVEKGARLGAGVTIVCGVRIGCTALVGAGSVVTRDVPAYDIWAGTPAKSIKKRRL